jgi:hypothetical protein
LDPHVVLPRLALWSSGEAFFISLYGRFVLLPSVLAGGHPGEDRLLFLLVAVTLATVLLFSLKAGNIADWMWNLSLFRAGLLAASLWLPSGSAVIRYLACTWWMPFLLIFAEPVREEPVRNGRLSAPKAVIGLAGMALLLGLPPFAGGSSFIDAFRALAWPASSELVLWVMPLLGLGLASYRVSRGSGNKGFFEAVLYASVAVEAFRFHLLLGLLALLGGAWVVLSGMSSGACPMEERTVP